MDYKKLIKECATKAELYRLQDAVWLSTHMKQCETAITDLLARAEAAERERDEAVHDRMVMEQKTAELVARAERAEENFSKAVDAIKSEREFAAQEREKREMAEKQLEALLTVILGKPIMATGQREVITFCGVPVDEAMDRVVDYPILKEKLEKAERCIDAIEEDLDRGNDNDWAREHIAEWREEKGNHQ